MRHEFISSSYSAKRSYLSMHDREVGGWREGIFHHPEGLVRVFECRLEKYQAVRMTFNFGGKSHSRVWEQCFGDKTLARLAREFVEAVCQFM